MTATYKWVDLKNPISSLDIADQLKVKSEFSHFLPELSEKILMRPLLRIISVELENSTSQRIKNLEVSAPGAVAWQLGDESPYIQSPQIKIPNLDPGEKRDVITFSTDYFPMGDLFDNRSPKVLQDDNAIPVRIVHIDYAYDTFGFRKFLDDDPLFGGIIFLLGIISIVILVFMLMLALYLRSSIPRRARFVSKSEVEELRQLIAYIDAEAAAKG